MVIGIIGAGKVGVTLGKYLKCNSKNVSGYYSRSYESALKAAEFTETKAYDKLEELVIASDTLFISTPDGEIKNVWDCIVKYKLAGKIICHFSGSLSSSVFSNNQETGADCCSVHPIFAFSDKYKSYLSFKDAFFTIEGDERAKREMQNLWETLGHKTFLIDSKNKIKYHAAATIASNYMIGLFKMSLNLLGECGFDESQSMELISPLVKGNVTSLLKNGCEKSLTGPIERNDIETVKKHLEVLDDGDIKNAYCHIGKVLVEIAKNKNPEREYYKLENILKKSDQ